jgi:protein required for attachment to host cells
MQHATWIVVADGARGRILSREPGADRFVPALPFELVGSRLPTRDRVTDRGGQTLERVGAGGHAKLAAQQAKEHDQEVLAKRLADEISTGRTSNRFDRLVLVAPPSFLGMLRDSLDTASRKLVVATHAKDLSNLDPVHLEQRLRELVAA